MKTINEIIAIACDECNGAGFVFWGNEAEFDVQSCACVNDGSLFWNGENN